MKALPCPLCGATPHHGLGKVEHCQLHGEPFQRWNIKCPKGHVSVWGMDKARALREWNARPGHPTPDDPLNSGEWHNPDDLVAMRRMADALSVLHYSILNPNMGRDDLIRTAREWYPLAMRTVPTVKTEAEDCSNCNCSPGQIERCQKRRAVTVSEVRK